MIKMYVNCGIVSAATYLGGDVTAKNGKRG